MMSCGTELNPNKHITVLSITIDICCINSHDFRRNHANLYNRYHVHVNAMKKTKKWKSRETKWKLKEI